MRQPSDGMPSRQPGGATSARPFYRTSCPTGARVRAPRAASTAIAAGPARPRPGCQRRDRGLRRRPARRAGDGRARGQEAFPVRQPTARPPRPSGGRHRRAVPASLPQSAPALVLAVPGRDTDLTAGPAGRADRRAPGGQPGGRGAGRAHRRRRAVATRPTCGRCWPTWPPGGPTAPPCAVVIPLIATVNPPVIRRLRESVAASGVNAIVSGFLNSNAMIAEALHIRLAEAGLARADRVRLFSIVTAADGVLIATVGRPGRRRVGQRDLGAARGAARAPGHHRVDRQRAVRPRGRRCG